MSAGRDVGHLDSYPRPLVAHSSFPMEVTKLGNLDPGPPRVLCRGLGVHACLVCEHTKCNHISAFSPRKEAGEETRQVRMSLLLLRVQRSRAQQSSPTNQTKADDGGGWRGEGEEGRPEGGRWVEGFNPHISYAWRDRAQRPFAGTAPGHHNLWSQGVYQG